MSPLTLTVMWFVGLKEISRAHVSSATAGKEQHHLHGTARSSRLHAVAAENRGLSFAKEWSVPTGARLLAGVGFMCVPISRPYPNAEDIKCGARGWKGLLYKRGTCNTFSSQHGPE